MAAIDPLSFVKIRSSELLSEPSKSSYAHVLVKRADAQRCAQKPNWYIGVRHVVAQYLKLIADADCAPVELLRKHGACEKHAIKPNTPKIEHGVA
ncbi:MAG: hypothetical protein NPIRA05_08480 [Nitrospirales bacterium]|nr:MAG: hypothetical protein NPIRA05_08480 [Nitrospirales bacterium]